MEDLIPIIAILCTIGLPITAAGNWSYFCEKRPQGTNGTDQSGNHSSEQIKVEKYP